MSILSNFYSSIYFIFYQTTILTLLFSINSRVLIKKEEKDTNKLCPLISAQGPTLIGSYEY